MKMIVHREALTEADPLFHDDVLEFLRVDHGDEYDSIQLIARAAASELEQFAQIALLMQTVRLTIFDPLSEQYLRLPIGPVADDGTPTVTIDGVAFTDFLFVAGNRPVIRWGDTFFDLLPTRMTVEYQAGFGESHDQIPADLYQAALDQAALLFDARSPSDMKSHTSPHMARIGARYRGVQA